MFGPQKNAEPWSFLGCLGSEDRAPAAWFEFSRIGTLADSTFLRLHDSSSRYHAEATERARLHQVRLENAGLHATAFADEQLLCSDALIVGQVDRFLTRCSERVALDISVMPKRFFFAILRRLIESSQVKQLVVLYTLPERHGAHPLSEDPLPPQALPLFRPPPEIVCQTVVVGVGFQTLGLREIIEENSSAEVQPLAPTPRRQGERQQQWQSLLVTRESAARRWHRISYVSALNAFETLDRLRAWSGGNYGTSLALAPFGPKPMSLGMALAAIKGAWPVYYTQPRVYHPDYSIGIGGAPDAPAVFGYLVKKDGLAIPV